MLQASGYNAASDVSNDGINQYLYDAEGRRVAKGAIRAWSCDPSANGFITTADYVLGPNGEQASEMSVSGGASTWSHTNVWAGGKLLATYDMTGRGLHFYLDDPLGTRRVQTDELGVIEQSCSSLPFGDGLSCTGSITTPPNTTSPAKNATPNQATTASGLGPVDVYLERMTAAAI
jgi:hypothetical protein